MVTSGRLAAASPQGESNLSVNLPWSESLQWSMKIQYSAAIIDKKTISYLCQ